MLADIWMSTSIMMKTILKALGAKELPKLASEMKNEEEAEKRDEITDFMEKMKCQLITRT